MDNEVLIYLDLDYFYCFFFIYAIVKIMHTSQANYTNIILGKLGDESTSMWFVHGLFFSMTLKIINYQLYKLNNPVLIGLVAILVSYIVSLLVKKPLKLIFKELNYIFK